MSLDSRRLIEILREFSRSVNVGDKLSFGRRYKPRKCWMCMHYTRGYCRLADTRTSPYSSCGNWYPRTMRYIYHV